MCLVTVRCPKTPSPGPDFPFRLWMHTSLTHLSGGQHTSYRSVWVSLEAGAGLMSGQPWEVQVSGCVGMCWELFWSRSAEFCSRAECSGCPSPGQSGLLSSKHPCCSPGLLRPSHQTAPCCPAQFIPSGYDA